MRRQLLSAVTVFCCMAVFVSASGCGLVDKIRAIDLTRKGNRLYLDGDYKGAVEKYLKAAEYDPATPNLYLNLGYAYFSIFNPDAASGDRGISNALEAIKAFDEHLKRVPSDDAARVFQAKTLLKAAPIDKTVSDNALNTFMGLLEKNPNDSEARRYLISLFIDCQRYDDALKFFTKEFEKNPNDTDSMKIMAIIAEKSKLTQDAVHWYSKRAEVADDPEKKAVYLYEVATYIWGLLHYQPDREKGDAALALIDKGLEAAHTAMQLKKEYAEAMAYANLLLLKRVDHELTDEAKLLDQTMAAQLREEAGRILKARKKASGVDEDETAEEDAGVEEEQAKASNEPPKPLEFILPVNRPPDPKAIKILEQRAKEAAKKEAAEKKAAEEAAKKGGKTTNNVADSKQQG